MSPSEGASNVQADRASKVLLLGARGGLGRLVHRELMARGHAVVTVDRVQARDPEAMARCEAGAIVNCAGASVALGFGYGWRGYGAVDTPIGLATVEAARRTSARLVYVAVAHPPALARGAYIAAHERVAAAMAPIDGAVVRPTGFFSAYAALLPLARRGMLFDIGDGRSRTNPIDERDLAEIIAGAITRGGSRDVHAGGPDVMTRREIFEHVAAASGRAVRVRGTPVWLARASGAVMRLVHPRMGQFVQFAAGLARHDVIAPALGSRRFSDYMQALAAPPPAELPAVPA